MLPLPATAHFEVTLVPTIISLQEPSFWRSSFGGVGVRDPDQYPGINKIMIARDEEV